MNGSSCFSLDLTDYTTNRMIGLNDIRTEYNSNTTVLTVIGIPGLWTVRYNATARAVLGIPIPLPVGNVYPFDLAPFSTVSTLSMVAAPDPDTGVYTTYFPIKFHSSASTAFVLSLFVCASNATHFTQCALFNISRMPTSDLGPPLLLSSINPGGTDLLTLYRDQSYLLHLVRCTVAGVSTPPACINRTLVPSPGLFGLDFDVAFVPPTMYIAMRLVGTSTPAFGAFDYSGAVVQPMTPSTILNSDICSGVGYRIVITNTTESPPTFYVVVPSNLLFLRAALGGCKGFSGPCLQQRVSADLPASSFVSPSAIAVPSGEYVGGILTVSTNVANDGRPALLVMLPCPADSAHSTGELLTATVGVASLASAVIIQRNVHGALVLCNDSLVVRALPSGVVVPADIAPSGAIENAARRLSWLTTTTPGLQTFAIELRGATVLTAAVDVKPGPGVAALSELDFAGAVAGEITVGSLNFASLTIRDQYRNLQVGSSLDRIDIQLQRGAGASGAVPVDLIPPTDGSGVWRIGIAVDAPGSYSLAALVNNMQVGTAIAFTVLLQCPPGTYAPTRASGSCVLCGANYYSSLPNLVACQQCASGSSTMGVINATSVSACTALPGYGMVLPTQYALCPRREACVGGPRACASGARGLLCKDCVSGHYRDTYGACHRCPPAAGGIFAFFALALISAAVCAVGSVVWALSVVGGSTDPCSRNELRSRTAPATLSLVVVALQIVGLLGRAGLNWPSVVRNALNVFNVFSLEIGAFASACVLGSFRAHFIATIALPLVFVVTVLISALVFRVLRPHIAFCADLVDISVTSMVITSIFTFAPIAYLPMARASLLLFACRSFPDGGLYLDAEYSVRCGSSLWWSMFPFALFGVAFYVIGVPAVMASVLWRNRTRLFNDPAVVLRYSSLYKLFRKRFYLTCVAQLGRRLLIVFVTLFLSERLPVFLTLLLLVIVGGAAIQARLAPYYFPLYDALEVRLSACLAVLVCCGFVAYADVSASSRTATNTTVVVIALSSLVALLLASVHAVVTEARDIRKDRSVRQDNGVVRNPVEDQLISHIWARLGDIDGTYSTVAGVLDARKRAAINGDDVDLLSADEISLGSIHRLSGIVVPDGL